VESDRSAIAAPRWPTGLQYCKYMDILISTSRLVMQLCVCPPINELFSTTSNSVTSRVLSTDFETKLVDRNNITQFVLYKIVLLTY
jgi:hypothetical protein